MVIVVYHRNIVLITISNIIILLKIGTKTDIYHRLILNKERSINMGTNNCLEDRNCIGEILKAILVLQEKAVMDSHLDSCDPHMLGRESNYLICNTRPIQLFTCLGNGIPWKANINKDSIATYREDSINNFSTVFRIEKVDGNCVTCRILKDNSDENSIHPFTTTNSFFTMDLKCVCSIKCLTDTFIDLV